MIYRRRTSICFFINSLIAMQNCGHMKKRKKFGETAMYFSRFLHRKRVIIRKREGVLHVSPTSRHFLNPIYTYYIHTAAILFDRHVRNIFTFQLDEKKVVCFCFCIFGSTFP